MSYIYFFICFLISPIFSAFFSSSETALANTTKVDGAVSELKNDEQATLLTILFGNHWSNQLPTMILSAWSVALFGEYFWIIMGAHTFYTLYLGEMLAKAYALGKANVIASVTAPFLLPLVKIMGKPLSRLAPKTQKTQDELCLEARLEAEMESEVKDLAYVISKFPNAKPLCPEDGLIIMEENVTIADAEEYCMKRVYKRDTPWSNVDTTWIQVMSNNNIGPKKTVGYVSLSMFHLLDWDHLKK